MFSSKLLHKIGMHPAAPMWVKMWCLRGIFINIQKHIEQLPKEQRVKFESVRIKQGRMSA